MFRFQQFDMLLEISELSQDLIHEIKQQLLYFRASVYKQEAAALICQKIADLQSLMALIPNDALHEPFADYQAEQQQNVYFGPGECSLSARASRLIMQLEKGLEQMQDKQLDQNFWLCLKTENLEHNVYKNRQKILALCQPGTRSWNFFQSL